MHWPFLGQLRAQAGPAARASVPCVPVVIWAEEVGLCGRPPHGL